MATSKKTDDLELEMPTIGGIDEDEGFLDFSDVAEATGIEALPAGWYPLEITGWKAMEVKKVDGAMPAGTKGTQFEFTVIDHERAGAKVWNTYWHWQKGLPFFKGLATTSGQFKPEQLVGVKYGDLRNGMIGGKVMGLLTVQKSDQYGDSNRLKNIKPIDAQVGNANDLMP